MCGGPERDQGVALAFLLAEVAIELQGSRCRGMDDRVVVQVVRQDVGLLQRLGAHRWRGGALVRGECRREPAPAFAHPVAGLLEAHERRCQPQPLLRRVAVGPPAQRGADILFVLLQLRQRPTLLRAVPRRFGLLRDREEMACVPLAPALRLAACRQLPGGVLPDRFEETVAQAERIGLDGDEGMLNELGEEGHNLVGGEGLLRARSSIPMLLVTERFDRRERPASGEGGKRAKLASRPSRTRRPSPALQRPGALASSPYRRARNGAPRVCGHNVCLRGLGRW